MKHWAIWILFIFSTTVCGQVVYTGKLLDKEDKSPLELVSITAKGSNLSAVSDRRGAFKISLPSNISELTFSHIGYKKKTVKLSSSNTEITVLLEPLPDVMEEMVITSRSVEDIIKELIRNSRRKVTPKIELKTYFREMRFIDNCLDFFSDAVINFYTEGEGSYNRTDAVVEQSRYLKFDNRYLDQYRRLGFSPEYNNSISYLMREALNFDFLEAIILKDTDECDFFITSRKDENDNEVNVIHFSPKKHPVRQRYMGTIAYDAKNMLILDINAKLSPKNIYTENFIFSDKQKYFTTVELREVYNYEEDKYFLVYKSLRTNAEVTSGEEEHFCDIKGHYELITIDQNFNPQLPDEEIKYRNKTLKPLGIKNYTNKYWEAQNILMLTDEEEALLKEINDF